jgi:hypothetical protein
LIAVLIWKTDVGVHKNDGIDSWTPSRDDAAYWNLFPQGPPPTLFRYKWYSDYTQYPNVVTDMVGYWAEARILGGVENDGIDS